MTRDEIAENYPDLLNYEEQLIWKAIFEVKTFETFVDAKGETQFIDYDLVDEIEGNKRADRRSVKQCWPELVGYAEGTVSIEELQAALQKSPPF